VVLAALTGCGSAVSPGTPEADKQPAIILADAAKALRHTTSYRVTGMIDPGVVVDVVVVPGGSAGKLTVDKVPFNEVSLHGKVWLQGAALWTTLVGDRGAGFGEDWVLVQDPTVASGWAGRLMDLDHSIPGVIFAPHPGLVKSRKVLDGRDVLELRNASDVYDVLPSSVPFPVRWYEVELPGPNGQPCGITLNSFNNPVRLSEPDSHHTLPAAS